MSAGALRSEDADLAIVGSGAAGLLAACVAAEAGLDVLVLEKASRLGGTSAMGGGVIWAPGHHLGLADADKDAEAAAHYLAALTRSTVSAERIDWFLDTIRAAVDYLVSRTAVRLTPLARPDYHLEVDGAADGGRSLDNEPFALPEGTGLGDSLRPSSYLPQLTMAERDALAGSAPPPDLLVKRTAAGIRTMGGALVGALATTALANGARLVADAPVEEIVASGGGWRLRIPESQVRARFVLLASGGYERSALLQSAFLPGPVAAIGAPSNSGDGLRLGLGLGAAVEGMTGLWGVPVIVDQEVEYDGASIGRMANVELTLPGSILVDATGRRFANEAQEYAALNTALLHRAAHPISAASPAWLIYDERYRASYPIAGRPAGVGPAWAHTASTLDELAALCEIDAAGLAATAATFNRDARTGVDTEFGRGASAQDRFLGDPRVTPNPTMAPISAAPFHAIPVLPGALGTSGGLATSLKGEVLDFAERPIPGLFAAGNVAASVFGSSYPGGGATLASAVARAYAAAKEIVHRASGPDGAATHHVIPVPRRSKGQEQR